MFTNTRKFTLSAWLTSLWRRPDTPPQPPLFTDNELLDLEALEVDEDQLDVEAMLSQSAEAWEHEFEKHLEVARAEAAAGTGPQPWDRDWIENNRDLESEMGDFVNDWDWHRVNDLLEVLDWALASPQGRRAQLLADHPANPWAAPLQLIDELRPALVTKAHYLLRYQAKGLGYCDQWIGDLRAALKEALAREELEA